MHAKHSWADCIIYKPVGDEGSARIEALDTMLFILTDPPTKIHCQDVLVHIQLFLCLVRFFLLRILPTGTPQSGDGGKCKWQKMFYQPCSITMPRRIRLHLSVSPWRFCPLHMFANFRLWLEYRKSEVNHVSKLFCSSWIALSYGAIKSLSNPTTAALGTN